MYFILSPAQGAPLVGPPCWTGRDVAALAAAAATTISAPPSRLASAAERRPFLGASPPR